MMTMITVMVIMMLMMTVAHSVNLCPLIHEWTGTWIFVSPRPISADATAHRGKQDGAALTTAAVQHHFK